MADQDPAVLCGLRQNGEIIKALQRNRFGPPEI